jgi:hypothetical protein
MYVHLFVCVYAFANSKMSVEWRKEDEKINSNQFYVTQHRMSESER